MLYPLKFAPILKERIWGGNKLSTIYGKNIPANIEHCGESWEISAVAESVSVVTNGFLVGNTLQELCEVYMADILGDKVFERFGYEFPLLIKFIDANDVLSIQVHPNDEVAAARHKACGKTEMWYVIDADKEAKLISGFNKPVNRTEYLQKLADGTLVDLLHTEEVAAGDAFFIPAGRVHAIGKGILLVEIQQTSDVTYRIFDWNRVDSKGKPRELHTDLALDVIDFAKVDKAKVEVDKCNEVELTKCPYFTVNRLTISEQRECDYNLLDSFVIYICVDGDVEVKTGNEDVQSLKSGECVLIPAEIKNIFLSPMKQSTLLEVYVS